MSRREEQGTSGCASRVSVLVPDEGGGGGIILSPISIPQGGDITVTWAGFTPDTDVYISVEGGGGFLISSNSYGGGAVVFSNIGNAVGTHNMIVMDTVQGFSYKAQFTITVPVVTGDWYRLDEQTLAIGVPPSLTLSPSSVAQGTALSITLTGFQPNSAGYIYVVYGGSFTITTDSSGGGIWSLSIGDAPGEHIMRAQDYSGNFAEATFTVTPVIVTGDWFKLDEWTLTIVPDKTVAAGDWYMLDEVPLVIFTTVPPGPKINISPLSGKVGTIIKVAGSSLTAGTATISFAGANVATSTVSAGGVLTPVSIKVPATAIPGSYAVKVTSGTTSASASFTVTAAPVVNAAALVAGAAVVIGGLILLSDKGKKSIPAGKKK